MKKSLLQRLFTTLLLLAVTILTWAYDFEVDGIYYNENSDGTSVTVTYKTTSYNSYSGSVAVPSQVTYNGKTYDVTSIGYEAFYKCTGLTSVTIPNSVTSISGSAFSGCSGLTSVTIPNSVTSIGEYTFSRCSGLTSVTIPESVTSIGYRAFYDCSGLTSVTLNANDIVSKTYSSSSNLGTIFGTQVKEYVLGDDVKGIGNYAFYGCTGLTSVTIPNSVTSIGYNAFSSCSGLTSVTIPNSVTSIGDGAFSGCSGLTSVTIPNSVTSIERYAFSGCSSLTSIDIPNSVTSIGSSAFYGCSGLTSVTIGNSVTSIGENAFYLCSGLTSVTIPNSVTSIEDMAFYGCSGLTSVTIPSSVTSIGMYAFYNTAWYDNQPDGLVYAGMIAYKYKGTMPTGTNISLKEGTLGIGGDAFRGCSGLTSITIPNSVTSIEDYAFEGCSGLTSVTIPNSVTSIGGGYTFSGCPLQTIVNRGDNDIGKSTFSDRVYLHTQLYVPEGTVWDYIFNTGWGEFHNIREFANNADNIRNNAVYLIADHSGRNFPVYDRATKSLKNVTYTLNLDDNDAGACWRVVKDGNDTYLYNIGAGMYAAYDMENKLSLSTVPSAVDIKVTKEGTMINGRPAMLVVNKSVTPGPIYITGDANGNGVVEIGDVTSVLTLMATPDATGYNNKAADANGNGEIEIGDVTTILTIMAGN